MKIVLAILLLFVLSFSVFTQVRPVYDQGAVGLGQTLQRLANTKRIMHIGAHPDDEDSDLLAYLARKEKARTVYLSLTRGDGGQNVIGPELFEALGIIRTEELLQARALDGAEQLFTRAFDFGYSKTLDEAKRFWDEETIKCDVVRAIRQFRPQVVNPRFGGTPRDGHGQHQFAGYIAPIAVKAAADPNQCPDAGTPWKVSKFYVGQGFRDAKQAPLQLNSGLYDPLIGKTYYQIAALGRSQHKTQEQGGLELQGDRFSGVNLIESTVEVPKEEQSMFDGLDTSLANLSEDPDTSAALRKIQTQYELGIAKVSLLKPGEALPHLLTAWDELSKHAQDKTLSGTDRFQIRQKLQEFETAIVDVAGVRLDPVSSVETIPDGESFDVNVNVFVPKSPSIEVGEIFLDTPEGWDVSESEVKETDNSPRARFFRERPDMQRSFDVNVPLFSRPTQPYFLEKPREGYLYDIETDQNRNLPFQVPLVTAKAEVRIDGRVLTVESPVRYRFADDTRGELRRELNIVPKVSVSVDQDLIVFGADRRPHRIAVNVISHSQNPVKGSLEIVSGGGVKIADPERSVEIKEKDRAVTFEFLLEAPSNVKIGEYKLRAEVQIGDRTYGQTMKVVAYDHIQTHRYYVPAETKIVVSDVKSSSAKIGYVMGSGDSGPEALKQMGYDVKLLDSRELSGGDLSEFDTIVVGIRASETNEAFIANNSRLLEFAKSGGALIVQYQKFPYQTLNLAPFPFSFNARVTDETAPVTILEPSHPVFNKPNKISDADFEGWVQERNLYAFRTFDSNYTPLLESHDPGEDENRGGMVYAKLGEGHYVYVSYAFFRQLPAGVPGAYRLFSNLVSLGQNDK